MWTVKRVVQLLKRNVVRWEPVGEWDGTAWHLRKRSKGLEEWLERREREHPDAWRAIAEGGRRLTILGEHFDYRLTPRGAGLLIERNPR